MKKLPEISSNKKKQQGSTLLEAMVALLILSFGILSLVGLQAAMINNSSDAKDRAEASYLANRLIGQIWTDIPHLANYANCTTESSPCRGWLDEVEEKMPNGNATVVINGSNVTITVNWNKGGQAVHQHSITATIIN